MANISIVIMAIDLSASLVIWDLKMAVNKRAYHHVDTIPRDLSRAYHHVDTILRDLSQI